MSGNQRQDREKAYAKVLFIDENLPGYVRDLSTQGCQIDLLQEASWEVGERKKIVIIPEEDIGFAPVHGTIEIRWLKPKEIYYSVGVKFVSLKDADAKENYKRIIRFFQSKKKD